MTQYVLHLMSYSGLVPGAVHHRGRVEGPHPLPCHGRSSHHRDGGVFCDEGHELPKQVRWDVEADWSEARRERWAASGWEDAGPQAFDSAEEVIDRAMVQFLDGMEGENDPAEEGDELWYGWVNPDGGQFDDMTDPSDGWGCRIAIRCTT